MKIVVIGAGEVGFQLSKGLSEEDFDITIIEISKERVQRASESLDAVSYTHLTLPTICSV